MARISEFKGIAIYMYVEDHPPPHFHARCGGQWVKVSIETGRPVRGGIPRRELRRVQEWLLAHRRELVWNWERAEEGEHPRRIPPL